LPFFDALKVPGASQSDPGPIWETSIFHENSQKFGPRCQPYELEIFGAFCPFDLKLSGNDLETSKNRQLSSIYFLNGWRQRYLEINVKNVPKIFEK